MFTADWCSPEVALSLSRAGKYLYRAVDKEGQTIEFMLSAGRDVTAAKRFFKKKMRAEQSTAACHSQSASIRMRPALRHSLHRKMKKSSHMIVGYDG